MLVTDKLQFMIKGMNLANKEVSSPISEMKNLLFALVSRNPFKCSYTYVAEQKKKVTEHLKFCLFCFNQHERGFSWDLTAFPFMLCIIHKTNNHTPEHFPFQLNKESVKTTSPDHYQLKAKGPLQPDQHCTPHTFPLHSHRVDL